MMRVVAALALIATVLGLRLWNHAGDGKIDFGAGYVHGTLIERDHVGQAQTSFGPHDTITWVAHFSEHAGATRLTQSVVRLEPDHTESPVSTERVAVSNRNATDVHGTLTVAAWNAMGVRGPGSYIMRYYRPYQRGDTLLAQGTFTLTR